jgi:hypothetical protein
MRRSTLFLIATVVTAGLTASGLAGVAAADELLSKKQFLKAANARCKKMHRAIDANFVEEFAGLAEDAEPSPAQIEAGVASLIGILRGAATDVEALQGPTALEEKVDAFLDRFNAGTRSRRPTRSLEKSD